MTRIKGCTTHRHHRYAVHLLAVLAAIWMVSGARNAFAQSGAGSIQGIVSDQTGAVIPDAAIHIANTATGVTSDTRSNSVGFYRAPNLFSGQYTITITAAHMKSYETSIQLLVDQAAVINSVLVPGQVTEKITIQGDEIQLTTTDNGTITSTLDRTRINQLPMNGRLLLTLAAMTTPGLEGGGQRANGLMPEALEYVLDGAPSTNRNFGGETNSTSAQLPDPDAVEEVRLETTNTSAQFATPGTAILTTKSGANKLHGSFFETARNNAIGNAKARQNAPNYVAPHLIRNEFGMSAGGPIVLPKIYHGKDKSFWFFAYERFSLAQTTYQLQTVPTPAMRNGDFSGLVNGAGVLQQLYDPATTTNSSNCNGTGVANAACRAPFANNQIPLSRISPAAKILYDITPLPTTADNPLVTTNLSAPAPTYQVIPTITFRLDHVFNENNRAYLRYTQILQQSFAIRNSPTNQPYTLAADGFPKGAAGLGSSPIVTIPAGIGYSHIFSPTFYSETLFSQQWESENALGGGNPFLNYDQMLGLPNNFGEYGFPMIGSNLLMNYLTTQFNYKESQIIWNVDENLTKISGRHQLQFGGRYRRERFSYLPDRSFDNVQFSNLATGLLNPASGSNLTATPATGYADADFFLGAASSYSVSLQPPAIHFHDMEFDAYFQDNYHATKNLTVNVGLRYEAHPSPWVKDNLMQAMDLKNHAQVFNQPMSYYIAKGYTTQAIVTNLQNDGIVFETPQQAGLPSTMIRNYDFTFGPRLALAYTPFGGKHGTVIRGAYGRYIYPVPTRSTIRAAVQNEPFGGTYTMSYTAGPQAPDGQTNYLLRAPQAVVMGKNSANVVDTTSVSAITPNFQHVGMSQNLAPDYVTQTNLTVEQPFKGNSALRLTWLWSHGTNLDHYYHYDAYLQNYNWHMRYGTAVPNGTTIGLSNYASTARNPWDQTKYNDNIMILKDGWSNDNALQANYQRLYHNGSAFQIFYVWSKALRMGGNTFRDNYTYSAADYVVPTDSLGVMSPLPGASAVTAPYLPPSRPAGVPSYMSWHDLNRYEYNIVDTAIPRHHIMFNGVVDLPAGRGKRLLGNANRFVNLLVGGFQIAGDASIYSSTFQVASNNWGPTNTIKSYRGKAPITDCSSGVCRKSYLWFNGYISPSAINAATKGISGLPSDYVPYQTPINNTPGTSNYGNNNVQVTLTNGSTLVDAYTPAAVGGNTLGANRFSKTFLSGPFNYNADMSIFKNVPVTQRIALRINGDAFNVFNHQGYNTPSATSGIQTTTSSALTPRQIQLTMRLTF